MAKRKRLTPANPDFLGTDTPATPDTEAPRPEPMPDDLETKGYPLGIARTRNRPASPSRPPIAQVAGEASAAAALSELTEAMRQARSEGRLVQSLKLGDIDLAHLVRDRLMADEADLTTLVDSLRKRGQQTPIEVVDRGEASRPRYGLISGWRRIAALERLSREDARFGQVLALVRAPKNAAEAYVAMVEENEIRVGLSYYERARIAVKSVEQGVYPDLKTALNSLFENVSRAKRSKIKSFTTLVEALDGVLRFPTAIGERLGLDLAKHLGERPDLRGRLRTDLVARPPDSPEAEQAHLADALSQGAVGAESASPTAARQPIEPVAVTPPAPQPDAPKQPRREVRVGDVKTRFDADTGEVHLAGPGVDMRFLVELETWLRRREDRD
ncbi:hypothetical protein DL237_18725 [Pseudooceanicola sediminis]|uniref:ParB-like N-terminal domain-containing protein n=1 Tax=Pseudooceanicola sediminis TaxID=2211117 RepID=A0A399IVZ3_9RHOB|nr:ParB N-terminal domain-containing protein [Pseudooceanicola sediminis]RII37120.1 hypothetical protein DL237_18725 [Pseudooceanicola sediminis]